MGQDTTKQIVTDAVEEIKRFVQTSQQEHFEDMKKYVDTTLDRRLNIQSTEIRQELHREVRRVEEKIDNLSAYIGEAIDTSNEENQRQLDNHERRIKKLERLTT